MKTHNQPNHVAISDPAAWLRIHAEQFKGETRASLEHCARQCAAAPELLEALKVVRAELRYKYGIANDVFAQVEAAIARATQEAAP